MLKKLFLLSHILFGLLFIVSCSSLGTKQKSPCAKSAKKSWFKKSKKSCCGASSTAGKALIKDALKGKIKGEVFFTYAEKHKVQVTGTITGLKPNQKFGFHVHEFGNCDNKGLLAGAHYNPYKQKHGGPSSQDRHLGDLGNLSSNDKGVVEYSMEVPGRVKKFLGRSVIIHAKPDDLKTQSTGNSGKRIACGVIVAAMPPVALKPAKDKAEKAPAKPADKKAATKEEAKKTATKPAKEKAKSTAKPADKAKKAPAKPAEKAKSKAKPADKAKKAPAKPAEKEAPAKPATKEKAKSTAKPADKAKKAPAKPAEKAKKAPAKPAAKDKAKSTAKPADKAQKAPAKPAKKPKQAPATKEKKDSVKPANN